MNDNHKHILKAAVENLFHNDMVEVNELEIPKRSHSVYLLAIKPTQPTFFHTTRHRLDLAILEGLVDACGTGAVVDDEMGKVLMIHKWSSLDYPNSKNLLLFATKQAITKRVVEMDKLHAAAREVNEELNGLSAYLGMF